MFNYLTNTQAAGSDIATPFITPQAVGDWLLAVSSYFYATPTGGWSNMAVGATGGVLQQIASSLTPVDYTFSPTSSFSLSNIIFDFQTDGVPTQTQVVSFGGGGIGTSGSAFFASPVPAGVAVVAVFQNNTFFADSGNMTFTDTSGNIYYHVTSFVGSSPHSQTDVFIAFNVPASGSLTMNWTASNFLGDANGTAWIVTNLAPIPPSIFIQAVPSTILLGQSSTLNWVVQGATSQSIDEGIGSVPASGSAIVSPTATTFYHLTAVNNTNPSNIVTSTAFAEVEVLGNQSTFSIQKVILTLKQDRIPVRGRNGGGGRNRGK